MDNETKGKFGKERDSYEYKELMNMVDKLVDRIDYLYEQIDEQGIVIPDKKKEKINNYVEKITTEGLSSLRIIINYKEEIIKILEGLFKVSYFTKVKNNFVNSMNERRERKQQLALEKEKEQQEREMERERERQEREQQKQKEREEKEALVQQKIKEKEYRELEKQREKEERILAKEKEREEKEQQKQREREEKEALALQKEKEKEEARKEKEAQKQKEEPKTMEEYSPFTMNGAHGKPEVDIHDENLEEKKADGPIAEEKIAEEIKAEEPIVEEKIAEEKKAEEPIVEEKKEEEKEPQLAAPAVAFYSPKEDTVTEEKIEKITPAQQYNQTYDEEHEKVNYLKYIIPILLLLLAGIIFFLVWTNWDSVQIASDKTEQVEEKIGTEKPAEIVTGLANCFPEITGSSDPVKFGNDKLKNAYYCCFDNRVTNIDPAIFEQWKRKNFDLIKCVTENLPDDYMLVVIGHANRTGYEEDMRVFRSNWGSFKYVVGNYTYSMQRAQAMIKELNNSINKELVLYYGVGSNDPRTNEGFDPEHEQNRRITFKIMKRDDSKMEQNEWVNKKENVKVLK